MTAKGNFKIAGCQIPHLDGAIIADTKNSLSVGTYGDILNPAPAIASENNFKTVDRDRETLVFSLGVVGRYRGLICYFPTPDRMKSSLRSKWRSPTY